MKCAHPQMLGFDIGKIRTTALLCRLAPTQSLEKGRGHPYQIAIKNARTVRPLKHTYQTLILLIFFRSCSTTKPKLGVDKAENESSDVAL